MYRPFRFGVVTGSASSHAAWVTMARQAEDLGYATLLVADHLSTGIAPLTALAVAAQATTSLRIGSFVFCNDYRHPAVLAKEVATLDLLSEGRFELGLGAGNWPSDYAQMGIPFDGAGTRVGRLEETIIILKKLFIEEVVNFTGKYYTITEMKGLPKPIQRPHPPIYIGSSGKRMLSTAAQQADIISIMPKGNAQGIDPTDATPEAMANKLAWVREAAGERFSHLEFSSAALHMMITDGRAGAATQPAKLHGPSMARMSMTVEQAIEHLLEQRERFGVSYVQVLDSQLEAFAPVIARLAGK